MKPTWMGLVRNCIPKDPSLQKCLYFKNYLHLIESGNNKFES